MSGGLEPGEPAHRRPGPAEGRHHHPLVRRLSRLVPLTEAERAVLVRLGAATRRVPAHAELLREGAAPEEAFLVLEGFAGRYKFRETGMRQILGLAVPGDLCDADAPLLGALDHTFGALTACCVAPIPRRHLADLLAQHPGLARGLRLSKLVEEATTREWLMSVGRRSALERVAHLLCELQVRLEAVGFASENGYDLALTQQDLGDALGLSNVHVNRTVHVLRERNLIAWSTRHLTILDLPRLMALAEFDPKYLTVLTRP